MECHTCEVHVFQKSGQKFGLCDGTWILPDFTVSINNGWARFQCIFFGNALETMNPCILIHIEKVGAFSLEIILI